MLSKTLMLTFRYFPTGNNDVAYVAADVAVSERRQENRISTSLAIARRIRRVTLDYQLSDAL